MLENRAESLPELFIQNRHLRNRDQSAVFAIFIHSVNHNRTTADISG